jgi:hypothetical protein
MKQQKTFFQEHESQIVTPYSQTHGFAEMMSWRADTARLIESYADEGIKKLRDQSEALIDVFREKRIEMNEARPNEERVYLDLSLDVYPDPSGRGLFGLKWVHWPVKLPGKKRYPEHISSKPGEKKDGVRYSYNLYSIGKYINKGRKWFKPYFIETEYAARAIRRDISKMYALKNVADQLSLNPLQKSIRNLYIQQFSDADQHTNDLMLMQAYRSGVTVLDPLGIIEADQFQSARTSAERNQRTFSKSIVGVDSDKSEVTSVPVIEQTGTRKGEGGNKGERNPFLDD